MKMLNKTIAWIIRHPVYAWCQYRYGEPYSTVKARRTMRITGGWPVTCDMKQRQNPAVQ
jgi:hypothetical protein